MIAVQAQVATLETDVATINTTLTTHTADISDLQNDVTDLQYNTSNITYDNLGADTTTNISSDVVNLSIPAGSVNIDGKLYLNNILTNDSLTNIITIGSADQSTNIVLNGTISMPLMDLFNVFTSTSNGFVSQI